MEFDDPTEIQLTRTKYYPSRSANPHRGTREVEQAKDKRVHGSDTFWGKMLSRWPGLDDVVSPDLYLRCINVLIGEPVY